MAIRVGRLEVETADHVVLRYTLAGVGNRGFAAVVDFLVAALITAGLEVGYGQIGAPGEAALGGVIRLLLFVLGWSYFIVLEWLWNGQTVGKRAYGLRVINEDGSPERLGDLAAGTFVVRAPRPQLDWLSLRTVTRPGAPVAAAAARGLSGEAQRIVREFVAREAALSGRDRARLATEIASRIRPHVSGIDAPDDLEFLRTVAATLREAGERRP